MHLPRRGKARILGILGVERQVYRYYEPARDDVVLGQGDRKGVVSGDRVG